MITVKNEYYPSSKLKARKRYKDGMLHGISTFYSEEGTIWATQNIKNGIHEGMHFYFNYPTNNNWPH